MKALWFEVTCPSIYNNREAIIGGWQDSLERIVKKIPGIELSIAFDAGAKRYKSKKVDGVSYYPIKLQYSRREKRRSLRNWSEYAKKLLPELEKIVKEVNPDIIHVFGTEWPFGLIAEKTNIPVVIHIQGAMAPYCNASFPPGYNMFDVFRAIPWYKISKFKDAWNSRRFDLSRMEIDRRAWVAVSRYMGRTGWDSALSEILHPGREYYHVEEALRDIFTKGEQKWHLHKGKIKLFSTGCSNFWKGPDMLLKTALILKDLGVDFEWRVAGQMQPNIKEIVERKVGVRFEDCNVKFIGFARTGTLVRSLCASTLYVHTAYVENSPNSICEAQCMGVPIVSTNVGGISTLVKDGEQGILVPANDPWQMAHAIIELSDDPARMMAFSENSIKAAQHRHSDDNIGKQLLEAYNSIIGK